MSRNGLAVVFLILVATGGRRQQTSVEATSISDVQDQIDEFVRSTMASKSTPGLTLAIVNGNDEPFSRGYGVKRLSTTDYVTNDTLFYIASTTKAFTATVLSQILLERNQSLETPVKEILTDFQLVEYYRQERATLTDLLAHRLGIPESLYNWVLGEVKTREDIVRRALYFKATEPFRGHEVYSNLFVIAAGLVVQALSSGSGIQLWEDVVRSRIFGPVGMTDSSFMDQLTAEQLGRLVTPYEVDWRNNSEMREISLEFFKHSGLGGPSGSIVSSGRDLAKWLYMLTHGGLNEAGQRVIDESVVVNTMSPHIVSNPTDISVQPIKGVTENYGLGWYTGFYNGYRMANHAGYMFGYQSKATVYPGLKLGIFTCINGQNPNGPDGQTAIHDFITDLLMPSTNNATEARGERAVRQDLSSSNSDKSNMARHHSNEVRSGGGSDVEQRLSVAAIAAAKGQIGQQWISTGDKRRRQRRQVNPLEDYVGVYGNFAFGNTTLTLDTSTGRLRGTYGDLISIDLFQIGTDRFAGRPDEPVWFFPAIDMQFGRQTTDNTVINVTVPILLTSDPPVFVRGRRMDEAPAPPTCDC
jgi:CubicO group peptidase (beta-lactamase class C family)